MLRIKPLSDEDKIEVLKAIRWTFITHEELLKLSMDPDFVLAKSMIMQGLSCKLDPNFAHTISPHELLFKIKPRDVTAMMVMQEQQNEGALPQLNQAELQPRPVKTPAANQFEKDVQDIHAQRLNMMNQQPQYGFSATANKKADPVLKEMTQANPYQKGARQQQQMYGTLNQKNAMNAFQG